MDLFVANIKFYVSLKEELNDIESTYPHIYLTLLSMT